MNILCILDFCVSGKQFQTSLLGRILSQNYRGLGPPYGWIKTVTIQTENTLAYFPKDEGKDILSVDCPTCTKGNKNIKNIFLKYFFLFLRPTIAISSHPLSCGAYTIKHYGFVIYGKRPGACIIKRITLVIYGFRNKLKHLSHNTKLGWKLLPGTNTLAYYGNHKLRP
jgi:hypothetical protein